MEIKNKTLRELFDWGLSIRRKTNDCDDCFLETEHITKGLLKDFDTTVAFLKTANAEEIAYAIDSLEDLAHALSKDEIMILIDIFIEKRKNHPEVATLARCEYDLEIEIAQSIASEK